MDAKNLPPEPVLDAVTQFPVGAALDALEDFRITQPMEIGSVLRQLMIRKDFLTVECSNRPHRIITRILAVDQNAGYFIYDCSVDQIHNRSLLESEENYFSATQDGVRIQFVCVQPEQCEFEGSFAFRSQLPINLYRMQRREYFRVETPLMEPYSCMVRLPDKRLITFDIFDLSLNGVGLRSKDPTLGELQIGTVFSKAVLDCRKMSKMELDLKITYMHNIREKTNPIYHFGCRFEHFPKSKESDLQRMITYLELARRGSRD